MIDLGLSKLAIIGVVALIVIGPEKLPKVARMAGTLYGRAQRYLHDVKSEVSREIELDELRNLHKEVHESAASFKADVEQSMSSHVDEVEALWDGREHASSSTTSSTHSYVSTTDIERKARDFRRKKLVRTSAVPSWYKHRHGGKTHVLSGAARVRKFRPGSSKSKSSFF
ncbi:Sec-independent protein translocase protein TatB [Massilia sp. IC2-477]|uniref:Sec-independent protein translocase protein TatB n=1 Tax=unclassified Massilia TaxID=2609279 RepID=UPI001D10CD4B|nr:MULTISPECIES: Sec-independent protein translocase protein TatB [unclassified Massilia]MCC2954777.1 Sec-independent protein translocase protein TatB [Massilia sp. IC2-477]MCC2972769.1 Sec-independent protein translocase protein TatB [Massilia sp. IC2-476]